MNLLEQAGLKALYFLDPERAHGMALKALSMGLVPLPGAAHTSPQLQVDLAGIPLPNPLGLAAGFDKNAVALHPLSRVGFGFVEVGAITPRPQPGNPRPRLFRLTKDQAVINRFGFNNNGMDQAVRYLAKRPAKGVIGLNLGANKDSRDKAGDFVQVLAKCGAYLDFATVNVSSPNTEKLRDLQGAAALAAVLERVMEARTELPRPIPVFVKIAPDLNDDELAELAEVALASGISGIIATNTTLARPGLQSANRDQAGGLSGQPLFESSTRVLAKLSKLTDSRLPIIGVGGVGSAEQTYEKIRAGATAVQLYSSLVYQGFSVISEIVHGLEKLLAANGFDTIQAAIGTGRDRWL